MGMTTARDDTFKVAFSSLDYGFPAGDNVGLHTLVTRKLREKQTAHQDTLG